MADRKGTEKRHRNPAKVAQPVQARDKLAFLLALVPWLIDQDRTTVDEAAAHFGVPADQIRDAVRLIAMSGVPGSTSAYQHDDLFDIDWDAFEEDDEIVLTHLVAIDDAPRFSSREAAALIAGLQYLSALPENADRAAIASLMGKLSRGASAEPSQVAVAAEEETDATLALIRDSVDRGVQLELDYRDSRGDAGAPPGRSAAGRVDRRRLVPARAGATSARRCARSASTASRTPSSPTSRSSITPGEVRLPDVLFEPSPDDLEVTIEVERSAMPLLADYIPDGALTTEVGDRIRTTLRVSHYHGLKRLVASMPGVVTVLAPDQARRAVAEWAAAGAARYA